MSQSESWSCALVQAAELVMLWTIFVALQLLRAHASRCSVTYALVYLAQVGVCHSFGQPDLS